MILPRFLNIPDILDMLKFLLLSVALGAAAIGLAAESDGVGGSFSVSDGSELLRLVSGTSDGVVDSDSFAQATIDLSVASKPLGNDLFEMNQSGSPQASSLGGKPLGEEEIVPLGDGLVYVASLGAVLDEDKIAGQGNWRMPISKTMALGIIAVVLLGGLAIRQKQIVR